MSSTTQPEHSTGARRPYQAEGRDFLDAVGRGMLADDPGLGKSRQAIEAIREPLLVVGPASLEGVWEDEIAAWADGDPDWAYVSYGSVCQRIEDKQGRRSKTIAYPHKWLKAERWGTVICDEAHYLKNRKADTPQAVNRLRAERLFLLTGTPIPNWGHEIYMPLKILRPEGVDLNSFWRWVEEWFVVWKAPWGARKIGKLQRGKTWEEFIVANRLDELMMRRTRDAVLSDLPPLTIHPPILVDMTDAQRQAYDEMKRDYLAWVEGVGEVVAWSGGARHSKLQQITTGLETLGIGAVGSGKLDMLQELMEERRHSPTVIGCHYRDTADACAERLRTMGIRTGVIRGGMPDGNMDLQRRAFQAGRITALVGTFGKISEGVTLTRADTAIMVERSWRPSLNEQFIRRIDRLGQTRPTNLITILTRNSIDQAMTKVLDGKTDQQVEFYTAQAFAQQLRQAA